MHMLKTDPVYRIYRCMLGMNQRNRAVSSAYGSELSLAESGAIPEILAQPGMSASELGPRLVLGQVRTSRLIAGMRRKGLLREATSAQDLRRKGLYITPRGEKIFYPMQKLEYASFAAAFERLSPSEQAKFKNWMKQFCKGYDAPEVAILPIDPPLMRETEGLSRAIGLLNSNIFGFEEFTPLEWHILARLEYAARVVTGSELAARFGVPLTTVLGVLSRLEKKKLLARTQGQKDKRLKNLTLTDSGHKQYQVIEREALRQIGKALTELSSEDLEEFATLFERYAGEGSLSDEIAIGRFEAMRRLTTEEDLAISRSFIISERVRQNLLTEIPSRIADENSYVFGLFCKTKLLAVVECALEQAKRRARVQHAMEHCDSNEILSNFSQVVLQHLAFLSGAKTLRLDKGRMASALWQAFTDGETSDTFEITL